MLAKTTMADVWGEPAIPVVPSIFPEWEAFHAEPNREQKSADLLEDRASKVVYWPHYWTHIRCGTRRQREIARSVIPGVLFAPAGMLGVGREREMLLDWARLHPVALRRHLTAAEIEIIREIAGKLAMREANKVRGLHQGDRVKFVNEGYAEFFGDGSIIAVAPGGRIRLKMDRKLFGGKDEITVSAAELELL